jgi:hypothetical protein
LKTRLKATSRHRHLTLIILMVVLTATTVALVVGFNGQIGTVGFLVGPVIKAHPELAIDSGVRGLVEVGYADSAEVGSSFAASRGERVTIPIFISFTSYDPDLKSIDISIDKSREDFGMTWQYWYEHDSNGIEIASGRICNNDLISYDKVGTVTVEAGNKMELNMFVDIPLNLPTLDTGSLMLVAAGIGLEDNESGIGLLDSLGGKEVTFDG